jgi:hypothetical protein
MAEQLSNSAASTLSAGIDNLVTSLTVANGTPFPASGNFRVLIDSELILVGARSGNTLSSLTRGVEATSAASHSSGAAVTHILTKTGLTNFIAENSISQTIADAKGDLIVATAADTLVRKAVGANNAVLLADSAQSDGLSWATGWTAYTPTWTSTGTAPALGNGTLTGRYMQVGKSIVGRLTLTLGSTSTVGTGTYIFSHPVAPQAAYITNHPLGTSIIVDASTGSLYPGIPIVGAGGIVIVSTAQPGAFVTQTTPVTFAVSDSVMIDFAYETA